MNYHLKKYIYNVKSECLRLGFSMRFDESASDTVALLSNPKSSKVVMAVFGSNIFGDVLIKAYLVNKKRYEWASAEGFSLDEMMALVEENVFIEIDPSKVASYLL